MVEGIGGGLIGDDRHEIQHDFGVFFLERANLVEHLTRYRIDVREPPDHLGVRRRGDLFGHEIVRG